MKKNVISENLDEQKMQTQSRVNKDKQTKQKSNAQKALPVLIVVVVALIIVLGCTLVAYYQVNKSNKQNANILEGVYASSYFTMVDNVNNLSVDLSKYSNLNTKTAKLSTMADMSQDCSYILSGLSVLPINQENVVAATKFFNQVNGVCEAYTNALILGKELTQEEESLFGEISLVVEKIKANLNKQMEGMYDTNFNFVDAGIFDNTGMNELSTSMGDLTNSSVEYPSMIFDGPFSTALETKNVKGLPLQEVGEEDAKNYLINVVFAGRKVNVEKVGETSGDLATYDFRVQTENKKLNAQVSKRGGILITLSGYSLQGDPTMQSGQAVSMAESFANNIGFENMQAVWLEVHENVAYINLAPVVDEIVYYPDLVKVKVDLTGQDIIGLEAVNYALNHVEREVEFNLSVDDAENLLGFDYEILKTSKAVIKLDGGRELPVYEFMTERMDGTYFYYIDANRPNIVKTLKLVSVKGVKKLI